MIPNDVDKTMRAALAAFRTYTTILVGRGQLTVVEGLDTNEKIREALDYLDAQPQAPLNGLVINEYQISPGGINDLDDVRLCRRRQLRGPDRWAIYKRGRVMNRDGDWEYEPLPSSRDDEFLARCRFDTPGEALAVYRSTQEDTPHDDDA